MGVIETNTKPTGFLYRCWNGKAYLWQAFWLVNVLGKLLFFGALALVGYLLWQVTQASWIFDFALVIPIVAYIVFVAVSVWRCSSNTKYQQLGALAKVWVIFYVVSMVGVLANAAKI